MQLLRNIIPGTILFFLFGPAASAQQTPPTHWSYTGEEGPSHWGDLDAAFATCKQGHVQSPIDIRGAKKADLPALTFDYKAAPLRVLDNGHTVVVNYAPGSTLTVAGHVYTLRQ